VKHKHLLDCWWVLIKISGVFSWTGETLPELARSGLGTMRPSLLARRRPVQTQLLVQVPCTADYCYEPREIDNSAALTATICSIFYRVIMSRTILINKACEF
jgi:hypothetical protein